MIRDETHRFAVTYHRKRRELRDFTSELTAIPGVGDKRKGRLLRHFGSIQRISRAGVSELAPFVGRKTAEEIADHFERQRLVAASAKSATDYTDEHGSNIQ
jgi:excinuclease ABC subunit C